MMLAKILIIMTMIIAVSSRGGTLMMRRSEKARSRLPPATTKCFQSLSQYLERVDRGKTCENFKDAYCLRENNFRVPRTELVSYVRDFAIEFDFKLKIDPATRISYLEKNRPRIPIIIYVFHDINTGSCKYEFDESISKDMRILFDKNVMSKAPREEFVRSRTRDGTATNRDRERDCVLYQDVDEDDTMTFVQDNANSNVRMEKGFDWIQNAVIGTRADLVNGHSDLGKDEELKEKFSGFISLERSHGENKRLSILVHRSETKYDERKQLIQSEISIYSSCGGVDLMASLYIADAEFLFKIRLLESEPDCDVSGRTVLQISDIIFDVLSKTIPPRIQMTSELMDAAKFMCHEDSTVYVSLSPIYYALKGMSFYAFGEGYMSRILKTSPMVSWIDSWFGHEHPLLIRRESAPVRDFVVDEDEEEEMDDYIWFTGIDHALLSRASILETEICSDKISMSEGFTFNSLCSEEKNLFWQEYRSVVDSRSDRAAVTNPAEPGSFVKATEQLYRISKGGVNNEAACRALNILFNAMKTSRLAVLEKGHITLAGLLAWLSVNTSRSQIRLPKAVIEHKS